MIRSKDLLLFVLVLLFLGIAIFATVAKDMFGNSLSVPTLTLLNTTPVQISGAPEEKTIDHAQEIARLRQKLAADTSTITLPPETDDQTSSIQPQTDAPAVQLCAGARTDLSLSQRWPLESVSMTQKEGARVVEYIQTQTQGMDTVGTSSESTKQYTSTHVTFPLLQLPLHPIATAQPHCLPGAVIGVSVNGSLIFNSDARLYQSRSRNDLIGYALDGFPIYGSYTGEVDTCGGYLGSGGYRYTVSPDRSYVLGCYNATPQSFMVTHLETTAHMQQ